MDFKSFKNKNEHNKQDVTLENFSYEEKAQAEKVMQNLLGKDKNQLMQELLSTYATEVKAGRMDKNTLRQNVAQFSSFLTQEQLREIEILINKL